MLPVSTFYAPMMYSAPASFSNHITHQPKGSCTTPKFENGSSTAQLMVGLTRNWMGKISSLDN